jgi:hypothetical protein
LLHGCTGSEGVRETGVPFLANWTKTDIAFSHAAVPTGTSEYARAKVAVAFFARVSVVGASLALLVRPVAEPAKN